MLRLVLVETIMFDVAGIQNSKQQNPKSTDPKFSYFASQPHQFPLCSHSRDAEKPGGSCSVQVADGAPDITLSSLSEVAAIESTGKAEDKEDTGLQSPAQSQGTELYERNLRLLVPFLENASIELQDMEKSESSERNYVLATWKLRTYLKLPWRPLIAIDGNTVYDLDRDFKIMRHVERWNVSALGEVECLPPVAEILSTK